MTDALDQDAMSIEQEKKSGQNQYEKHDCFEGCLTDEREIGLEKIRRFKQVIDNGMLGDFDAKGKYQLSEEITKELVDMPKKIDYVDELGIHARGFLGDKVFSFIITHPVEQTNGYAYCFLQLLETIDFMGGYYVNTNSVIVATYDYKYNAYYDQNVRNVFHLKEYSDDDTGEEGRAYFADNISIRLSELDSIKEGNLDTIEKLDEIYFNHRIKLLGLNPDTAKLMAEFKALKNKVEPFVKLSSRKYAIYNQVLDEVLSKEKNKEILRQSQVCEQMEQLDDKFAEKSIQIQQRIEEVQEKETKQKEKEVFVQYQKGGKTIEKPASKPFVPGVVKGDNNKPKKSKSAGPSKSGGGDKKKKEHEFDWGDVYKDVEPAFVPMAETFNEPSMSQPDMTFDNVSQEQTFNAPTVAPKEEVGEKTVVASTPTPVVASTPTPVVTPETDPSAENAETPHSGGDEKPKEEAAEGESEMMLGGGFGM